MLPNDINRIYIYKGKMPIKSGYSTKILVHKEGIMTNEEIYKYADKKLKKQEQRFDSIFIVTFVLFFVGYNSIIWGAVFAGGECRFWVSILCVVSSLLMYLIVLNKYSNRHNKMRREFTYNLVRKDERNRCAIKIERYEHEGSK
jgi:Flp pilus assembly protein TadB